VVPGYGDSPPAFRPGMEWPGNRPQGVLVPARGALPCWQVSWLAWEWPSLAAAAPTRRVSPWSRALRCFIAPGRRKISQGNRERMPEVKTSSTRMAPIQSMIPPTTRTGGQCQWRLARRVLQSWPPGKEAATGSAGAYGSPVAKSFEAFEFPFRPGRQDGR
jgi:hypothetical protein